jgi:hypothetical protein
MRAPALRSLSVIATAVVLAGAVLTARPQDVRISVSNPADVVTQSIPKGTSALTGQVRDAASNTPVPGAIVTAIHGVRPIRALTDSQGRFTIAGLPKGSFHLMASRTGFSEGAYGQLRPSGPSLVIDLGDGEQLRDLVIHLWPQGVIAGTVVDELGEPVIGATVRSYRRSFAGGRLRLAAGPFDATDDRGVFRITGLDAGEYLVGLPMTSHAWPVSLEHHMVLGGEWPADLSNSSSGQILDLIGSGVQLGSGSSVVAQVSDQVLPPGTMSNGRFAKYLAQFFAGASIVPDATAITLAAGEERPGIGLTLRAEPTWNVSGTVTGLDTAVDDLVLRLSPAGATAIETAVAVTDFRGRFTFLGVPSGTYVIRALRLPRGASEQRMIVTTAVTPPGVKLPIPEAALPTGSLMWAEQAVTVDGADATAGPVALRAGARLRGRITFDGSTPRPAPEMFERMRITLSPADERTDGLVPDGIRGRGERDAQFATMGAPAGRYVVAVTGLPDGWSLGTVMFGGRDVSVEPFDLGGTDVGGVTIQLTDRPASIAGKVSLASGEPDPNASVIVFPVAAAKRVDRGASPRQLRSVRTDRTGMFRVDGLSPGQYFIAAVTDPFSDWQQPRYLEALVRVSTRVDLAVGESRQTSLQAVKIDVR